VTVLEAGTAALAVCLATGLPGDGPRCGASAATAGVLPALAAVWAHGWTGRRVAAADEGGDERLNPNYGSYLQTATQLQRWTDFPAHVADYLVTNTAFVLSWARNRRGFFWPVYPLAGGAVGLSFQHFSAVLRGQITDEDVRRKLRPGAAEEARQAAT
jgi:hypothetical protein